MLKGNEDADAPLFRSTTPERSRALLMAVIGQGTSYHARAAEWSSMHRAYDAVVELFAWQKNYLLASIFETLQAQAFVRDEEDYGAAITHARQAIELQKKSGQSQTLYIPWSTVADALIRMGKSVEGLQALRTAHSLAAGESGPIDGALREKIVQVEIGQEQLAAARKDSADFAEVASHSDSKSFRGRALLAQSSIALADKRYDDAVDLAKAALLVAKDDAAAQDVQYEVLSRVLNIGVSAMDSVPYEKAMALCTRLDRDFPDLPIPVTAFANQIKDHRRRLAGDFDALLREQIQQVEAAQLRGDLGGQVSALQMLALDYAYLNESTQEVAALGRALAIDKAAPAGTVPAQLHFNLLRSAGDAYLGRHDVVHARAIYKEITSGIDAIQESQTRADLRGLYGDAELGKAAVAAMEDDPETAREIYRRALQTRGPGTPAAFKRSNVLLKDAQFERELNEEPETAMQLYQQAIAAFHDEHDRRWEISARLQLVRLLTVEHRELKDSQQQADENLTAARAEAEAVMFSDAQWRVEYLSGISAENQGRADAALAAYGSAVGKLEQMRAGLKNDDARESLMDQDWVQDLYRRLINLLTAGGDRETAWFYLERDKARTFLESLQGRRFNERQAGSANTPSSATERSGVTAEIQTLESEIVSTRASLAPENLGVLRSAGKSPEMMQMKLKDLEARFALLRTDKELQSDRSLQPLSLRPVSMQRVQSLLAPGTALIEYGLLDNALTAFIVTRSQVQQIRWSADTRKLPAMVRSLRDQMANPAAASDLAQTLSAASEEVLAPVARALPPNVNRLIVIPTGVLNYIPIQALLMPDGRAVLDHFTVTYLPSASVLEFLKPVKPAEVDKKVFLGALGNVSVDGWAPLPGTLREINALKSIYPGARHEEEAQFHHAAAVSALQQYSLVHFATHGVFEEEAPLFSALLVAPSAGEPERLSLYELLDVKVKARLVILSACETNRGRLFGGDEIAGLTRTFLQAGADDVVSSLWKVSDDSTALLMSTFHARLRAGATPATALRQAQLAVRAKYPQPFYWAAFVNTGID